MYNRLFYLLFALSVAAFGCNKNEGPDQPDTAFSLNFHNDYNLVEAQYAVFLSDKEGLVRAFRWLPGSDSAVVQVPDAKAGDRFDCTLFQIKIQVMPNGARDTTVELTTYTNLFNGASFHLRDLNFLQNTDLGIQFTGLNSLDSIVVPDGLTFALPQPANNFRGEYRVLHTGRIWCRVKINGEPNWRYVYLENITGDTHNVTLDATTLPLLNNSSASIDLPLFANWEYQLDRIIDLDTRQFLPLGAPLPIPGGPIPIFDQIAVFEPTNLPAAGYRLRASGYDLSVGGFGYACDLFFDNPPSQLPALDFDFQLSTPVDNRQTSLSCSGFMQLLALRRTQTGAPRLTWEVLLEPANTGQLTYRLPEVPSELSTLFPGLKNYDFGQQLEVRAESYQKLNAYPQVIARRMLQGDPLWQMKAGYVARMRVFK